MAASSVGARYRIKNIVTTQEQLGDVVAHYLTLDSFIFDVETRGQYRGRPERAEVAWIGLAGPGRTDVIPCGHINGVMLTKPGQKRVPVFEEDGTTPSRTDKGNYRYTIDTIPATFGPPPKQLWPSQVFGALEPLFFSGRRKIGHNTKFDLTAIAKYYGGVVPPPPYGDTIVLHHLLDEAMGAYKLDALIAKRYGLRYSDGKLGKIGIDHYDFWSVAKYQHLDVRYTWLLWKPFFRKLIPLELMPVFDMEMGVLEALIYMEREGALIDTEMIEDFRHRIDEKSTNIKRRLHKAAGRVWNVDAALEKGWFVYKKQGHQPRVFTPKTNQPSTAKEHLEAFADVDPMVGLLAEYSQLHTLKATFVDGLYTKLVEGKLHPSFLPAGTTTGRFSCAAPNLQNIPRVTEERVEFQIRDLFIAPPGHQLIVADYSQIEYRLFAHFSRDQYMIDMFNKGVDAHSAMASLVLGKPPEQLTPEERTVYGKVVNFAIGFGAGPGQIASSAKVSMKKAKEILAAHEEASPKFYAWKKHEIRLAKSRYVKGEVPAYVRTMSGRMRRLNKLFSLDQGTRMGAERQAISTIVQGSAADIMKRAMIDVHHALKDSPVQPILTVHDELVTICPIGQEDWAVDIIRKNMENAAELRVPLKVDINVCYRWSAGK